jgi:hypothetical protein
MNVFADPLFLKAEVDYRRETMIGAGAGRRSRPVRRRRSAHRGLGRPWATRWTRRLGHHAARPA